MVGAVDQCRSHEDGGRAHSLYAYVCQNPIKLYDPSGTQGTSTSRKDEGVDKRKKSIWDQTREATPSGSSGKTKTGTLSIWARTRELNAALPRTEKSLGFSFSEWDATVADFIKLRNTVARATALIDTYEKVNVADAAEAASLRSTYKTTCSLNREAGQTDV